MIVYGGNNRGYALRIVVGITILELLLINGAFAQIIPLAGDLDGDGVDSYGTFDTNSASFNFNGKTVYYGLPATDLPIIGDWDNDGNDEIGIFRPDDGGLSKLHLVIRDWSTLSNNAGSSDYTLSLGGLYSNNIPFSGDWDGVDGDDYGGFNPDTNRFYLYSLNLGTSSATRYKDVHVLVTGGKPISGDWDGNGIDEIGVFKRYDPNSYTNSFYLDLGLTGGRHEMGPYELGNIGDEPLIGDWDGNGYDNIGIYRPSENAFYPRVDLPTLALFASAKNVVSIGDHIVDPNGEIRVPIRLNESTGVAGIEVTLEYNPAVVMAYSKDCYKTEDVCEDVGSFIGYNVNNIYNTSGYIKITTSNGGGVMMGNLTIGYVRLRAIGSSGSSSLLDLNVTLVDDLGDDIAPESTINGLFTVQLPTTPVNQAPGQPIELSQFKSDATTPITVGGATSERTVVFSARVSDPDSDKVRLQVELRRTDEYGGVFDENQGGLKLGNLVTSGSIATASAIELINGNYHWRARAVDETGNKGGWVEFGGNPTSETDFILALPASAQNLVSIGNYGVDSNGEIRVPILLNNASGVGGFDIRLDYTPSVVSAYSNTLLDKGDFSDFYAADNARNTTGYIETFAIKFVPGGLSGNLVLGYVRLHAIGSPGSSSLLDLTVILYDDAGDSIPQENTIDGLFTVNLTPTPVNQAPGQPIELSQFKSDATTPITVGGATAERTVVFSARVSDPDGDKVRLQVELRRTDEYGGVFDENQGGLKLGDLVTNGSIATASAIELIDGSYHWRARAVDEKGNAGEWVEFGGNPILDADFIVTTTTPTIMVGQGASDPIKQLFIDAYNRNGGETVLGKPTTVVYDAWGHLVQDFPGVSGIPGGAIMYNSVGNSAYYIHGAIWEKYKNYPDKSKLGLVTSDEKEAGMSPQGTTGRYNKFENGHIHWISNKDNNNADSPYRGFSFITYGELDSYYNNILYGTNSWLGFPIMDQEERDGHSYSDFEGGYISWDQTKMEYKDFEYSKGTIRVTTTKETATFKLIGRKIYTGSGKSWSKTDLPYGDYYIIFDEINGYVTPFNQKFSLTTSVKSTFKSRIKSG